jgi:hypothetical protein
MDFGKALAALKTGQSIRRATWNKMFLSLVANRTYIVMHTPQGNEVPWLASQSDMLDEDWDIIQ